MLTVLTLLLVLNSGQRSMPLSQAPQAKRSDRDFDAVFPFLDSRFLDGRRSDKRSGKRSDNRYLRQASAVSGAALGVIGAFAGEGNALSSQVNAAQAGTTVLPRAVQPEGYTLALRDRAIDQSEAVLPNLPHASEAAFSPSESGLISSAYEKMQTAQTSLIQQAQDGSWTLSTGSSTDASGRPQAQNAVRSQAVISDLAEQTARTRQACNGRSCQGLDRAESRLAKAQEEVQNLQAQLDDFESHQEQQDAAGYQQLLTDRIFEVAQQKQDLLVATEQNQQRITQLKMRLVQMDADLELAERALDSDANYQSDWNRLLSAEQNLMNEFSQVKVDATDLNEIYSDYQHYQQQAQLSAGEALGSYLLQAASVPGFIERSPDALTYLQELTTSTHEYRAQKLRQVTIGQIEKRLNDREGQLLGDVSEYESLQRELAAAKETVAEYESARDGILAKQTAQESAKRTVEKSSTALGRVRRLAPLLPKGSVSQGVVFAVLAAGAIAAIAARRRSRKPIVPSLALQAPAARDYSFRPTALQQANLMSAIALPSLHLSAAQLQTEGAAQPAPLPIPLAPPSNSKTGEGNLLNTAYRTHPQSADTRFVHQRLEALNAETDADKLLAAPAARLNGEDDLLELEDILSGIAPTPTSPQDDFERRILAELMEITGQTTHMLNAAPDDSAVTAEDNSLTIERMVQELNEAIGHTTPDSSLADEILANEIKKRESEAVQLSLDDIDIFAEHAVQWILKDLGVSEADATLEPARIEANNWSPETVAEIEAISIESLEIVRPAPKAPYPVVEEVRREFATVAA